MYKIVKLLFVFIMILFVIEGIFVFIAFSNSIIHYPAPKKELSQNLNKDPLIGQPFFVSSNTQSIENISLDKLPYFNAISGISGYGIYRFISTEKFIFKYNTATQKVEAFSNLNVSTCTSNTIVIGNYLYASCSNKKDKPFQDSNYQDNSSEIYKVNLLSNKIDYIYGKQQGLLNGFNHFMVQDKSDIWVGTFQGAGKIDTITDHVDFYDAALDSTATRWGIDNIVIDDSFVWITVTANTSSNGSVTKFNKKTKQFTPYGPTAVKISDTRRLDVYRSGVNRSGIKVTSTGIDVLVQDSNALKKGYLCLLRSYTYESNIWRTAKIVPINDCEKFSLTYFTPTDNYRINVDKENLKQVDYSSEKYILDGRTVMAITPLINTKKYILTNASIDVIDSTNTTPTILMTLPHEISPYYPNSEIGGSEGTLFYVDPITKKAIIVNSSCIIQERDSCNNPAVLVIDLNKQHVIKTFNMNQLPIKSGWDLQDNLHAENINGIVTVKKDEKTLFSIDINNNTLR